MSRGLTDAEARFLPWALYAVLFVLSGITAWLAVEVYGMSDKYVRLERYQRDTSRVEATMEKIDCKLDRLIERAIKP